MLNRDFANVDPSRLILAAPVIFILHVIEEAPGFVDWFNRLVPDGINQRMFITVNVWGLVITLFVTALLALLRDKITAYVAAGWLGTLMFGNAIFHIVATIAFQRYAPGVITATLLYLPFFVWFVVASMRRYRLAPLATSIVIVVGAAPMLLHGYRIVFEGRRLF